MGTTNETGPHENEHQVQTGAELARAVAEQNRGLAEDLIERARREGLQLVGENGLLTGLVKLVLEGALEAERSTATLTVTGHTHVVDGAQRAFLSTAAVSG
jgi:hypothetical protein